MNLGLNQVPDITDCPMARTKKQTAVHIELTASRGNYGPLNWRGTIDLQGLHGSGQQILDESVSAVDLSGVKPARGRQILRR